MKPDPSKDVDAKARMMRVIPVFLLAMVLLFALEIALFFRFGIFELLGPLIGAVVIVAELSALVLLAFLLIRGMRSDA